MEAAKPELIHSFADLQYLDGYGNHFATEAKKGALPIGQNSPQKCPYDLYAEQLSGTAFTVPRASNQRTWIYRILPSANHRPFAPCPDGSFPHIKNDFFDKKNLHVAPNQIRWKPLPPPTKDISKTFVQGLVTQCGAGDPTVKQGNAVYLYSCNKSMKNEAFYSSDGDFLIVPHTGTLHVITEFGLLTVKPREILVIPRGIRFAVEVNEVCGGYVCEVFKGHFRIPDLGPIGANGLANPRDFQTPVAWYENVKEGFKLYNKYQGEMFVAEQDHSPFDVVAWHGNYYPYKYNLDNFNAMNTVTFDHPDPSIFTVLTCPTDEPGVANIDFVIFPPRWIVSENTFRPAWFHRNVMSEYLGAISTPNDEKKVNLYKGCSSLSSMMTSHGLGAEAYEFARNMELKPTKNAYEDLEFMFESSYMLRITKFVMDDGMVDADYENRWSKMEDHFSEKKQVYSLEQGIKH